MVGLGLIESARALAVDGWTAEAVAALRRAGLDAILLKGPAIACWLYDRGEQRGYVDADLLVDPERMPDAERVLRELGYELRYGAEDREGGALPSGPHAESWFRVSDRALIDLHHTLPADIRAEEVVWPTLWERAETLRLAGVEVPVLDLPSRAMMVSVHAAHHGPEIRTPMEDLRRGIERVPDAVWEQAALVAESFIALPQFAAGLRLLPEGAALAERIGLPSQDFLDRLEKNDLAAGFERLAQTRGVRASLALLWREMVPTPAFMHWWAPWSRGGRLRLAAAYAYRIGWLAVHAIPGLLEWRRQRRRAGA